MTDTSRSYTYLVASGSLPATPAAYPMVSDPVSLAMRMEREAQFYRILGIDGRWWNSLLHPRDRFGRFIRTFSKVFFDPFTGWGSATERRNSRRKGGAFQGKDIARDDGGDAHIIKVDSVLPDSVLAPYGLKPGDLVKVKRDDLAVKTVKARLSANLMRGKINKKVTDTRNRLVKQLDRLDHQDLVEEVEKAYELLEARPDRDPDPQQALDRIRAVGEELQKRTDRELQRAGIKATMELQPKDIPDKALRQRMTAHQAALDNVNTLKHNLGDREYEEAEGRDRTVGARSSKTREALAEAILQEAGAKGQQVLDLTNGPENVQWVPLGPIERPTSGAKGILDAEGPDVLPELRPALRQSTGQGDRRLGGIGQRWQAAAPGDRFVVDPDGREIGVGEVVHYAGGGRGKAKTGPVDGVLVRVETRADLATGDPFSTEDLYGYIQYMDPGTGQIQQSRVKGDKLSLATAEQLDRFVTLAKSAAASDLIANRPAPDKRNREKATVFKDALEQARATGGSILATPGARRRSSAGRDDRFLVNADDQVMRRGDYVRTPEGAIGRIESIDEFTQRATVALDHAQRYPKVAANRLTKLHGNNHDVVAGQARHGGGLYMPSRQEAADALGRLGFDADGPVTRAILDGGDSAAIKAAMNADPAFMAAIDERMVPLFERRNEGMAKGQSPSDEDIRQLQDWDAVVSASGGYFRADDRPAAPDPATPPAPSPEDPPNPQDPSNPTKAVTPDGTRTDTPPTPAPEARIQDTTGYKVGAALDRARQRTEAMMRQRGAPVAPEGLLPNEFQKLRDAVDARDPEAFYSAIEAMERRIRGGAVERWRGTPLRASVVEGRNSGREPLAGYLREKYGDDLFNAPEAEAPAPTPGATEARPTSEADAERPPGVEKSIDELNDSLSERLISEGSARVLDGDGNPIADGFAVIPADEDIARFDAAPTDREIVDFLAEHPISGDRALAAWQSDDGTWNLSAVDIAPDKATAHEIAVDDGGSGQYIDIADGMVYNAVPHVPGDNTPDSSANDVVDDRSRERGTRPSPDGNAAELVGTTDRQKEIIQQVADAEGANVPDGVRETLNRMASGTGTFTADEMREAVDWLKKVGPSEIWSPEEYTASQRNGLKASVLNLAKRLSEDSGATGPDPYPSKSTAERRSREVAELLTNAFDNIAMSPDTREQIAGAIAQAREFTRTGRYTDAADTFRGLADLYDTASEVEGYNPRISRRTRLHADRLEGAQSLVPAAPTKATLADVQRLYWAESIGNFMRRDERGRFVAGMAQRARDQFASGDIVGGRKTLQQIQDAFDSDPEAYGRAVEERAQRKWQALQADDAVGAPQDADGFEQLEEWRTAMQDFVDTHADASPGGVVDDVREMLDGFDAEVQRRADLDAPSDEEQESSAGAAEAAARSAADAVTPEAASDMSDEELVETAQDLDNEADQSSWTDPETVEALGRAFDDVVAEKTVRDAAPSTLTDAQRDAVDRASGDLSKLDDAKLEALRSEVRDVQSSLPDDIDPEAAGRTNGAVDRVEDEIADRVAREVYDDEEEAAPEAAPEPEAPATTMPDVSEAPSKGGMAGLNELYQRFMDREVPVAESVKGSQAAQGIGDWVSTGRSTAEFSNWLRNASPEEVRDLFDRVRNDPDFGDTVASAWDVLRKYDREGTLIPGGEAPESAPDDGRAAALDRATNQDPLPDGVKGSRITMYDAMNRRLYTTPSRDANDYELVPKDRTEELRYGLALRGADQPDAWYWDEEKQDFVKSSIDHVTITADDDPGDWYSIDRRNASSRLEELQERDRKERLLKDAKEAYGHLTSRRALADELRSRGFTDEQISAYVQREMSHYNWKNRNDAYRQMLLSHDRGYAKPENPPASGQDPYDYMKQVHKASGDDTDRKIRLSSLDRELRSSSNPERKAWWEALPEDVRRLIVDRTAAGTLGGETVDSLREWDPQVLGKYLGTDDNATSDDLYQLDQVLRDDSGLRDRWNALDAASKDRILDDAIAGARVEGDIPDAVARALPEPAPEEGEAPTPTPEPEAAGKDRIDADVASFLNTADERSVKDAESAVERGLDTLDDTEVELLDEAMRKVKLGIPEEMGDETADYLTDLAGQIQDEHLRRRREAREAPPADEVPGEDADTVESGTDETPEPEPQDLEDALPEGTDESDAEQSGDIIDPEAVKYPELEEAALAVERIPEEDYEPTMQQKRIIAAIKSGKDVIVRALAGTGKTSTLLGAARRIQKDQPLKRIIYIAFNKSVQEEAAGKFPANTEVRTANSLAWAAMGRQFTDKTSSFVGFGRNKRQMISDPNEVFSKLGMDHVSDGGNKLNRRATAALLNDVVTQYMISADRNLSMKHVRTAEAIRDIELSDRDRAHLLEKGQELWQDFADPNGRFKMSQDALVKLWALSGADFRDRSSGVRHELGSDGIVFFDEAQDINPVLAQVVGNQKSQLVTVGDGNQAIYGFRGATDQLDKMKADYDLDLTESHRFGSGVAEVANRMLRLGKSKHRVKGSGPKSEIIQPNTMEDPDAILARSNAGALASAVEMIKGGRITGVSAKQYAKFESIDKTIKWLKFGGTRPYNFYEDLEGFNNWNEVVSAAKPEEGPVDPVARLIVSIHSAVEDWGDFMAKLRVVPEGSTDTSHTPVTLDRVRAAASRVEQLIDKVGVQEMRPVTPGKKSYAVMGNTKRHKVAIRQALKSMDVNATYHDKRSRFSDPKGKQWFWSFDAESPQEAQEVMETIQRYISGKDIQTAIFTGHMSKGLEWDSVRIADDFRPFYNDDGDPIMPPPEELRLFYVMLTRAKKRLDPGGLGEILNWNPEDFDIPSTDKPFPIEYVGTPSARDDEGSNPWLEDVDLSQSQGSPSRGNGPAEPNPFQPGAPEGDSDQEGDLPNAGDTVPAAGPAGFALTAAGESSPWF